MKVKSLSRVRLLATPWTAAYQAPLSMEAELAGFSQHLILWTFEPKIFFPGLTYLPVVSEAVFH